MDQQENPFAKYFALESESKVHLHGFMKFMRWWEKTQAATQPSIGAILHNPDVFGDVWFISEYVKWVKAGSPEE